MLKLLKISRWVPFYSLRPVTERISPLVGIVVYIAENTQLSPSPTRKHCTCLDSTHLSRSGCSVMVDLTLVKSSSKIAFSNCFFFDEKTENRPPIFFKKSMWLCEIFSTLLISFHLPSIICDTPINRHLQLENTFLQCWRCCTASPHRARLTLLFLRCVFSPLHYLSETSFTNARARAFTLFDNYLHETFLFLVSVLSAKEWTSAKQSPWRHALLRI